MGLHVFPIPIPHIVTYMGGMGKEVGGDVQMGGDMGKPMADSC